MKQLKLKRNLILCVAASAFGFGISCGASAADQGYVVKKSQAEVAYDADIKQCDTLSGNTKDVCVKDAKVRRTNIEADAEAVHTSAKARSDADEDKQEAKYDAANERCDQLDGSAQTACQDRAKVKYKQ